MTSTEEALVEIAQGADSNSELAVRCAKAIVKELQHVRRFSGVVACLEVFISRKESKWATKALKEYYAAGYL